MKALKTNKSSGPFSIPTKVPKLLKTSLSEPISLIASLSFEMNTFLGTLKQPNVTPIFKKDDHTLCNNYRPVWLFSNIRKIIERLVRKRSTKFLNLKDMLYKKKIGFRNDHSTTQASLELTEKIRLENDNEKCYCHTFLELQKAFDNVNHDIFPEKLEIHDIIGIFKSFSKDRKTICNNSRNIIRPKHDWLWFSTGFCIRSSFIHNFQKWVSQCNRTLCCAPFCRW